MTHGITFRTDTMRENMSIINYSNLQSYEIEKKNFLEGGALTQTS